MGREQVRGDDGIDPASCPRPGIIWETETHHKIVRLSLGYIARPYFCILEVERFESHFTRAGV